MEPKIESKGCISMNPLQGDPIMLFEVTMPNASEPDQYGYRESTMRLLIAEGTKDDWEGIPIPKETMAEALRLLDATKEFLRERNNPHTQP